jgi:hypothetical protein
MCIAENLNFLKRVAVGITGVLTLGLTAQAQIFTGSISFTGGATVDQAVPNATTITSFFGPPAVLGGSQTGAYASVPGGTTANFTAPISFNPLNTLTQPLWSFTVGAVNYSFVITSVTTDQQVTLPTGGGFLNIAGGGIGHITGYSDTPEVWSITGTTTGTGGTGSLTFTMGDSVTAVPEPGVFGFLLIGGLLLAGRMLINRRQEMCSVKA